MGYEGREKQTVKKSRKEYLTRDRRQTRSSGLELADSAVNLKSEQSQVALKNGKRARAADSVDLKIKEISL